MTLAANFFSPMVLWAILLFGSVIVLLERWIVRRHWKQIVSLAEALAAGERPATFIVHGDKIARRIALALEELAEQRQRLEQQMSREGFNFQAIHGSLVEGVMVVDTDRCVHSVNASFLKMFEVAHPPAGRSVLHTLRNAAIDDVIRTTLSTGEAKSREITVGISGRHLAMSAAPVRDASETVLGVAATFHDITQLKKLEQVRRDFVGNVSHELRTPLSIFQGHLEMLLEDPNLSPEERHNSLVVLKKHSQRLNALVEDLLTLARLESRHGSPELAPVHLDRILEEIAQDWKFKFSSNRIQFRCEVAPDLPPIHADAFRLEQVMYNLLDNARKYTPAGGEVIVIARPASDPSDSTSGAVELVVKDTGSGIPPADIPHIFERFYRADKARSRALGGTGLGLSIVKHIVHLHGGSVRAESVYGSGTSIILSLPVARAAEAVGVELGEIAC